MMAATKVNDNEFQLCTVMTNILITFKDHMHLRQHPKSPSNSLGNLKGYVQKEGYFTAGKNFSRQKKQVQKGVSVHHWQLLLQIRHIHWHTVLDFCF